MINRLDTYLASRPRRAAVIVLTLAVAFILVLSGLVLELSHFGQAPYPSQELGFSLVDGNVLFTQGPTLRWHNETSNTTEPVTPYSGAMGAFGGEGYGWGSFWFGDEPRMSAHTGLPSIDYLPLGGSIGLDLQITDLTSNGFFDNGDTILFRIATLQEDTEYFIALAFFPQGDTNPSCTEMSFAIHNGELYSWYSDNLPAQEPWWAR